MQEAKKEYMRSYEVQDNPFARMKLAVILLEEERPLEAISQIETAFSLPGADRALTMESKSLGRYMLAVAYAKKGDLARARTEATRALSFDPASQDIKDLLQQIDSAVEAQSRRSNQR